MSCLLSERRADRAPYRDLENWSFSWAGQLVRAAGLISSIPRLRGLLATEWSAPRRTGSRSYRGPDRGRGRGRPRSRGRPGTPATGVAPRWRAPAGPLQSCCDSTRLGWSRPPGDDILGRRLGCARAGPGRRSARSASALPSPFIGSRPSTRSPVTREAGPGELTVGTYGCPRAAVWSGTAPPTGPREAAPRGTPDRAWRNGERQASWVDSERS